MQSLLFLWLLSCLLLFTKANMYSEWSNTVNQEPDEKDALDVFKAVQKRSYRYYKRRTCRRWNSYCAPWSGRPEHTCCYNHGLSCRCNLWGQNCKCVSRLWGK